VSCTSAKACVAVGFSVRVQGNRYLKITAFAERWNGVNWTLQPVAKVKHAIFTQLFGVSCSSPKACTAVGSSNADASLVERWNGSVWKVQPTPHPRTFIYAHTFLNGVSCSSSSACVAVGESDTLRGFSHRYDTYRSLAERWNGRSWSSEPTPRPQNANEAFLNGVSCVTRACTTVGYAQLNPANDDGLLAESWSGKQWNIQPTPEPASPAPVSHFGDVSCTSAAQCMAVTGADAGSYLYPGGADDAAVAEQESGAGWVLLPVPGPTGARYFGLAGVSCTSPTACMAVGEANTGSSASGYETTEQLIERWTGASWTIQSTPTP
jgi:hypothetical protein